MVHVTDTQIGLLGEHYSLALNVIFFIHFDTSFSPSARLKMSREKSVSREISPLTTRVSFFNPPEKSCVIKKRLVVIRGNSDYVDVLCLFVRVQLGL